MGGKKEFFKQIHFLLCESCFWCASYLSLESVSITRCPKCYNKIEWMPISDVNLSKLDYSSQGNSYTIHSQLGDRKEK